MRLVDGRFELVERLGQGGVAIVHRARDLVTGRTVVVKMLRPEWVGNEEVRRRFQREARSAARLSHPGIVRTLETGVDGDRPYIVQEDDSATDLESILRREGQLEAERAVEIAAELLDALDYAHRNGTVHRDVKPSNVLITTDRRVKLTDFGVARVVSSDTRTLTQMGAMVGTVHYMSPEQAQGQPVGPAADIYSVGVVLYRLLTGRLPFDAETAVAVALQHVQKPPPPMYAEADGFWRDVEACVLRALAKSPSARYESAAEFRGALSLLLTRLRQPPSRVLDGAPAAPLHEPIGAVRPYALEETVARGVVPSSAGGATLVANTAARFPARMASAATWAIAGLATWAAAAYAGVSQLARGGLRKRAAGVGERVTATLMTARSSLPGNRLALTSAAALAIVVLLLVVDAASRMLGSTGPDAVPRRPAVATTPPEKVVLATPRPQPGRLPPSVVVYEYEGDDTPRWAEHKKKDGPKRPGKGKGKSKGRD